eukprot:9051581-Lingulodinium_polyedra.AAC.1
MESCGCIHRCPTLSPRDTVLGEEPKRSPKRVAQVAKGLRTKLRAAPTDDARRGPICMLRLALRRRRL